MGVQPNLEYCEGILVTILKEKDIADLEKNKGKGKEND